MTRDELATRSEGALEIVEGAVDHSAHLERVLRAHDWIQQVRGQPSLLRDEIERERSLAEAVARIDKLAPHALKPLGVARQRLSKIARQRLEELIGVPPTATTLEDLLVQLLARSIDMKWEADRIARGWKREERANRLRGLAAFGGIAGGCASFYGLLMIAETSLPVAVAPAAIGVLGGLIWLVISQRCPACGSVLDAEKCPHCGQTRPQD